MIGKNIPIQFALRTLNLTWSDLAYGYHMGRFIWKDLIDFASLKKSQNAASAAEWEMAAQNKSSISRLVELADQAASGENIDEDKIRERLLFLILYWIYENKENIEDPLAEVESIFADFDYPAEMYPFIKYMPPSDGVDPSRFSKEENEERLTRKWRAYLDEKSLYINT